ncbi:MAG: cyclic nucleotide-binding domain-containing protein [Magnetococcales bacterium]|nr:cyclic nucleotide-binding domain-containing protein [Magnetococcales bacterium]
MKKIRKIKIIDGVFWIEVPDAGLYMLCGCPADSVKHLMKRGLIISTEQNGATFETGPNTILLSDVLLQNGHFSNLAEFPVLQMLYRQGMIIPNHPNNTGAKPLLIGTSEQVQAQMRYIYRGNYGLISKEELMEAGLSEPEAVEMMRLKLKFAFGNIHPSDSLLESIALENEVVEIREGVTIRRIRLNIFEISYDGETVSVNLNLALGESYDAPYPLGRYQIKREYFGVIHSGEGDGWDINRPCMSSILMYQGSLYLIDAGPNLIYSLEALGIGISEIEGIFHTHAHDDHFAGITALIRAGHRIKYFATPLVRASVAKKLSALLSIEEEDFYHYFDIRDLKVDSWNDIDGLEVKPYYSPHPVETNILIFRTLAEDGYRSYAHYADIVALKVLKGMVSPDESDQGISQRFFDEIQKKYDRPANLKKIDVGGGMIHGETVDFINDQSDKIILSHTSFALSSEQREIGSSASFGTTDVLIPDYCDSAIAIAYEYMRTYFPESSQNQLRCLLNNEVVTFNPGTIICKEKEVSADIYLVLTGTVEVLQGDWGISGILSAGSLLGEISCLYHTASQVTFRASSFVRAVRLPGRLYLGFVQKNNYYTQIKVLHELRSFLQETELFGEAIPYPKQNEIAQAIQVSSFGSGEIIAGKDQHALCLIKSGQVICKVGTNIFETLGPRDYFGEESALFDRSQTYDVEAKGDIEIYQIPTRLVRDIPIVLWKLFEKTEKRRRSIINHDVNSAIAFQWRDTYRIGVKSIDDHHQGLFEMASHFIAVMTEKKAKKSDQKSSCQAFLEKMENCFAAEEKLFDQHGGPELANHVKKHQMLIETTQALLTLIDDSQPSSVSGQFSRYFQNRLVKHFLTDDHRMGLFLNAREIF